MKKTIAVLGLGLFGSAVAKTMAKNGSEVIAIDSNMDHVEEVLDSVYNAVQADFTKIDQLKEAGVGEVDTAVVATGEKLEVTILGIMNLKKLGIQEVIVKTKNLSYKEVLLKVGATRVILPEVEMGVRLANELSNTSVLDTFELDEKYHLVELNVMKQWIGNTLNNLNLRSEHGLNIIAIKSSETNQYNPQVDPNYLIREGDVFLVFSENKKINTSLDI
ncbi:MAG TPA: TrkA family potassium uptake protein [Erysipelothrix sp.]|nr:TrkA family potassium uptake protein [Erysipelothrix sp.]